MSFLLDTNICSAHLKRPAGLMHRFTQHSGRLSIATVALGELYAWAYRHPDPTSLLDKIENDLLRDVLVLDYDAVSAKEFGRLRGSRLGQGLVVSRLDLMIGAVALVHDHTLVTHNTADFQNIPGLRLADWLA